MEANQRIMGDPPSGRAVLGRCRMDAVAQLVVVASSYDMAQHAGLLK